MMATIENWAKIRVHENATFVQQNQASNLRQKEEDLLRGSLSGSMASRVCNCHTDLP